jgi:hypothetical protein
MRAKGSSRHSAIDISLGRSCRSRPLFRPSIEIFDAAMARDEARLIAAMNVHIDTDARYVAELTEQSLGSSETSAGGASHGGGPGDVISEMAWTIQSNLTVRRSRQSRSSLA